MTHVLVNGAKGNMGKAAVAAINADSALTLVSGLDKDDNLAEYLTRASNIDVVVDLTHPSCVFDNVQAVLSHGCHAVVGTTGLTEDQLRDLNDLATTQKKAVILEKYPNAIFTFQYEKQRYFTFLGTKKERKLNFNGIKHLVKPYPKKMGVIIDRQNKF